MNLELEAYEGELTQLRKVFKMVRHLSADKLDGVYFICGEGGEKELPNQFLGPSNII